MMDIIDILVGDKMPLEWTQWQIWQQYIR